MCVFVLFCVTVSKNTLCITQHCTVKSNDTFQGHFKDVSIVDVYYII